MYFSSDDEFEGITFSPVRGRTIVFEEDIESKFDHSLYLCTWCHMDLQPFSDNVCHIVTLTYQYQDMDIDTFVTIFKRCSINPAYRADCEELAKYKLYRQILLAEATLETDCEMMLERIEGDCTILEVVFNHIVFADN